MHPHDGIFVVVDGLDGIGKGVATNAILTDLVNKGKKVYDLHEYWNEHANHPSTGRWAHWADLISSSEPTYAGVGKFIRDEITSNNERIYTAAQTAQAFALDRKILYQTVILPALKLGTSVVQSRSVCSSLVYQRVQALENKEELTLDDIMAISGNAFALKNAPDLLILPIINDIKELIKRLDERDKKDNSIYENLLFQKKMSPFYQHVELKSIFEAEGTAVIYLDAGISEEHTKKEAVRIVNEFEASSEKSF